MTDMDTSRKRFLPEITDDTWNSFNTIRKKHELTWQDVFTRFKIYSNGIEYIFAAPGEMTKNLKLDLNTVMGLINLWIDNIRLNWKEIHGNHNVVELFDKPEYKGKAAVCIGAGPSAKTNNHLKQLRDSDAYQTGKVVVFSTAHSLKDCLDAGITPDFVNNVDGSPLIKEFIDYDLVDKYADKINMVFNASTHPDVIKTWQGKNTYYYLSGVPQNLIPNVDTFLSVLLPELPQVDSGGNSGTFNFSLAAVMGFKDIALIGMDLAYEKDNPYTNTQYHDAYALGIGTEYKNRQDMIDQCFEDFTHPVFNVECYTDFVYQIFQNSLIELAKFYKKHCDTRLINASEGGAIYDEDGNIECMTLKEFLGGL